MAITQKYLKNPDRFPGPDESEPWGDRELWIDFVGGPYHVSGLNETQYQRLLENFGDVCISNPGRIENFVAISVLKISPDRFQPPPPPPSKISFELQPRPHHVLVAGELMCGQIECNDKTAGLLWAATDGNWFTRNVFENFFRMLVTHRLSVSGGLLLHSAGIVSHDRAYLFPGHSGKGKSTLSRLSLDENRTVLSDDMNAVTWHEDGPRVEKVPFAGDLGRSWSRSSSYPLQAIFALHKSDQNSIRELPRVKAIALMVACAPYLNGDPYRAPRLLENLEKLTETVATHILDFSLGGNIWPVIEETIQP